MTEKQCETDRIYGTDGEWCRNYCPEYGTGRCHYDPETKKMMVRDEEESVECDNERCKCHLRKFVTIKADSMHSEIKKYCTCQDRCNCQNWNREDCEYRW